MGRVKQVCLINLVALSIFVGGTYLVHLLAHSPNGIHV